MAINAELSDIHIRGYQTGDASALAYIFFESVRCLGPRCYTLKQVSAWAPAAPPPDLVHARAMDGRTVLVAVNSLSEAVAFAEIKTDGHIDQLYCLACWSGIGIASMLVERLLEHAVSVGMHRVSVNASELALVLFERKGFEIICRRDFILRGVLIHHYAMERALR